MKNNSRNFLLLLIIPLIITILVLIAKKAAGPYWLGVNSDPSYLYLINSLYWINHTAPFFVDHPGVTLQILGALIIKGLNIGLPPLEIIDNVLTDPEYYLHALHTTLLGMYIISLIAVGLYAYKKTKDILFALLLQMAPFLFLTLKAYSSSHPLTVIVNINSDTVLMVLSNLSILCILRLLYNDTPRQHYLTAALFGLICGLGMTTKITFLPMLLIPVILIPRIKSRLIFVLTLISSWTLLILPITSRYEEMYQQRLQWLKPVLLGKGKSSLSLEQYLSNFKYLITESPIFFALLIICFIVILLQLLFHKKFQPFSPSNKKKTIFLTTIAVGSLAQFACISKVPGPHYLTPAIALFGLLLALLYQCLNLKTNLQKRYAWSILFFLILGLTHSALQYQHKLRKINNDIYNFSKRIYSQYPESIIFSYYRSSSPYAALEFGASLGSPNIFSEMLRKKYPSAFFYNQWFHTFHRFHKNVFLSKVLQNKKSALLYGSPSEFHGVIKVKELEAVHDERLYQIISTHLDEAHKHYLISKNLEAAQNYKAAYIYAIKAKILGRPSLDDYINSLKELIQQP